VKAVRFEGWESEAVVWGVNQASAETLQGLLDNRAASSLLTHRPFTAVAQMGSLAYVGATALRGLESSALDFWSLKHGGLSYSLAGVFDGVSFDEASAQTALDICNKATQAQLTAHAVSTSAAKAIIAARAFVSLGQVSAVSGVGTATMNALLAYAQSGQWTTQVDCEGAFQSAVAPHLSQVLFLSESDRPFDVVMFTQAGQVAPTAASVLKLIGAPSGFTAESRAVANFWVAVEPANASADANAPAALKAAFDLQLTDVVYVAVHRPASDPDHAQVAVYLLGRTRCGDLVGLHSVAVET
jgi:DNA uptake protein ComE-like DNA-binding protein